MQLEEVALFVTTFIEKNFKRRGLLKVLDMRYYEEKFQKMLILRTQINSYRTNVIARFFNNYNTVCGLLSLATLLLKINKKRVSTLLLFLYK